MQIKLFPFYRYTLVCKLLGPLELCVAWQDDTSTTCDKPFAENTLMQQ